MIDVVVTDRDLVEPFAMDAQLLRAVQRRHLDRIRYQARGLEELARSRTLREAITPAGDVDVVRARLETLMHAWTDAPAAAFQRETLAYRLYSPSARCGLEGQCATVLSQSRRRLLRTLKLT